MNKIREHANHGFNQHASIAQCGVDHATRHRGDGVGGSETRKAGQNSCRSHCTRRVRGLAAAAELGGEGRRLLCAVGAVGWARVLRQHVQRAGEILASVAARTKFAVNVITPQHAGLRASGRPSDTPRYAAPPRRREQHRHRAGGGARVGEHVEPVLLAPSTRGAKARRWGGGGGHLFASDRRRT